MRIFDVDGVERDPAWLSARYGPVNVRPSTAFGAFRVLELRESIGPAVYVVKVLDEDGQPMQNVMVARHWPYRDENPELDVLPNNEWFQRGVYGPTNENGDIGFGTGGGDYIDPTGQMVVRGVPLATVGASSMFVLEWDSDCLENMGTLGGTEHAHMDTTFGWVEGEPDPEPEPEPEPEPDPEPEPEPDPEPDVIAQVRALIEEAQALLDEALELLGA